MPMISLDLLDAHPGNANVMPEPLLAKLAAHIAESGRYPPLIVRPAPPHEGRYQILDGHHRAEALRRLGHTEAQCEVWNVDDDAANVLLLTLNRLQGRDDPFKRGELLARLSETLELDALAAMLPDDSERIARLIALTKPAEAPAPPRTLDDMPHAVTFFLSGRRRATLLAKLDAVARDRSEALAAILHLDEALAP